MRTVLLTLALALGAAGPAAASGCPAGTSDANYCESAPAHHAAAKHAPGHSRGATVAVRRARS